MLNQESLSQLKDLKKQLHEQTERATGVVRGTRGRFGFVRLDDNRDIFLPPEQMQRVFPGDRVRIAIHPGTDGKNTGEIEALLESPLGEFTGAYVVRGQGHFIEPDLPQFNRLIFIPHSERKKCKPGDLLRARVDRHPIKSGKSQCRIIEVIGAPADAGVESRYAIAKYGIRDSWRDDELEGLCDDQFAAHRKDLREVPFLTIDAAETRDVDDALYAEKVDDGWKLLVAIADPTAFIKPGSPLERAAMMRGATCYLPGNVVPMLPDGLSGDRCSLLPEMDRAALLCEMHIADDGQILEYGFAQALIRSYAKLRYRDVSAHIEQQHKLPNPELSVLHDLSQALLRRRRELYVVMEDKEDFRLILNDHKKIETIFRIQRNSAHRLVEECMIAANRCVADWLKDDRALFVRHDGVRSERVDNLRRALKAVAPELTQIRFTELAGYIELNRMLSEGDFPLPLRTITSRMLKRAEFSETASPHFGLGMSAYTTFTSPLRRYPDFYVHRCLRAKLLSTDIQSLDTDNLAAVQATIDQGRLAAAETEERLKWQYMADKVGETFNATITQIHSGGFIVKLDDNGITGFVDSRSIKGKLKFNPDQLTLSNSEHHFQLDMPLRVTLDEAGDNGRALFFTIAAAATDTGEQAGEVETAPTSAD